MNGFGFEELGELTKQRGRGQIMLANGSFDILLRDGGTVGRSMRDFK